MSLGTLAMDGPWDIPEHVLGTRTVHVSDVPMAIQQ